MFVPATAFISGYASLALGCPDSVAAAHEPQVIMAVAVREPGANQTVYSVPPGFPWSMAITVSVPDTFTFRIYARNSAGDSPCVDLATAIGHADATAVEPPKPWHRIRRAGKTFDLQGRRVDPRKGLRSGWYSDTLVVR